MILLISFKLKSTTKDYTSLYAVLKSADSWSNYLGSTWIIRTDNPINTWLERLRQQMSPGDYMFIVDITKKERNGFLPKEAWEWLQKQDQSIEK